MPWTVEDVPKFKKNLSSRAAKQWVRIANSALKSCMKKGGDEKTCAASAIRQANGVVMNTNESKGVYSVYKNKQVLDYEVKLTVHQEKAHLVVPVVMMVEGVHNGSQGPLLHTIAELGKFPESWNGRPVVIYHPEEDGHPISANSPEVVDSMTVGRVYNTSVDGLKLKAELWLDEDKLNNVSDTTLEEVNETKEIEVSLGMFTENEMEEGEYEGEKYVGIAHSHRPDHLAILPDQIGACSCADGCGIGANKNEDMKTVDEMMKALNTSGFSVNPIGDYAKQGYQELMNLVQSKLRALDTKDTYCYLEEMYDDYIVYNESAGDGRKLYKQEYKLTSGVVEFIGVPVEVHREVKYVTNNGLTRTRFSSNNKKEDMKMTKNECPKCLEKINAVIANKDSGFVEADREWLEVLSEATLDKVITPRTVEVEKVVEKVVEVNKLAPEDQAALAFGKRQMKERRDAWMKGIQDNTEKGIWTDEKLGKMDDDTLEAIYKSVKTEELEVGDYSFNTGGFNANRASGSGGLLYPAGVEVKTDK